MISDLLKKKKYSHFINLCVKDTQQPFEKLYLGFTDKGVCSRSLHS